MIIQSIIHSQIKYRQGWSWSFNQSSTPRESTHRNDPFPSINHPQSEKVQTGMIMINQSFPPQGEREWTGTGSWTAYQSSTPRESKDRNDHDQSTQRKKDSQIAHRWGGFREFRIHPHSPRKRAKGSQSGSTNHPIKTQKTEQWVQDQPIPSQPGRGNLKFKLIPSHPGKGNRARGRLIPLQLVRVNRAWYQLIPSHPIRINRAQDQLIPSLPIRINKAQNQLIPSLTIRIK